MTDEITTYRPAALADLSTEINDTHAQAMLHAGEAMNHALRCGDLLIKAKATVRHGGWLPWLRQNIAFSDRTAQGYMRLSARFGPHKRNAVADLSVRGVLKEIASPRRTALFDHVAAWLGRNQELRAKRPTDLRAWSEDDLVGLVRSMRGFDEIMHWHGVCTGDDELNELCLVCCKVGRFREDADKPALVEEPPIHTGPPATKAMLFEAIGAKLSEQRRFVFWWGSNVAQG